MRALDKFLSFVEQCIGIVEEVSTQPSPGVMNRVAHRKRTNKEFRFGLQIGECEMDNIVLNLGSDINILLKSTWEMMKKLKVTWSPLAQVGESTSNFPN